MIKRFLLGSEVAFDHVCEVFAHEEIDELVKSGLLILPEDRTIQSRVRIYPYQDFNFLCDFGWHGEEPVYCPGEDSLRLAQNRIQLEFDHALDLCCGSGIQAILAGTHCRKVIGVDINPRAVYLANLNRVLNDVRNVEFRQGNLYEPVQTEEFHLILANPPFVPTVTPTERYRDGGPLGDEILGKVMEGLPAYLKDNGFCQIVTHIHEFDKQSQQKLLKDSARDRLYEMLILSGPEFDKYDYALAQHRKLIRNRSRYEEVVLAFLEHLDSLGFKKGCSGVITLKKGSRYRFKKILAFSAQVTFDLTPSEKLRKFYQLEPR